MLKSKIKRVLSLGLLSNILGVLQSILLARLLGPELRGELAVPLTFVLLVLPLSSLGFKQNLAYLEGKKSVFVNNETLIRLVMLCVVITLLFTLLYSFIYLESFQVIILQVFLLILVRVIGDLFCYKLLVLKKAHEIAKLSLYRSIIEVLLIVTLYFFQVKNLTIIISVFILTYLFYGALILYFNLKNRKSNNSSNIKTEFVYSKFLRKGIAYSIPLFLININTSFDVLMLAKLATSKSVGIYQVAVSVANMLWVLPTLLGGLIFSESLDMKLSGLVDKLIVFYRYLFRGAAIMFLPILLSHWFFITLFGEAFEKSSGVFNILIFGYYAMLIYKVSNGVFASHGLVKVPVLIFSLSAVLNIGLNLYLIPLYDSKGAAVATLTSYLLCAAMFYFYTHKLKSNNVKRISI